jgi:hypothetical protein
MSILKQMSAGDYRAAEGIASSDFRLLEISPLHYERRELFKLEGPQFDFGSLLHTMVLEPDEALERFAPEDFEGCDLNKNSKAYKEARAAWLESVGERIVVSAGDWETARRMTENVRAVAGGILEGGQAEGSCFAYDEEFGVRRKCRPDYYLSDAGVVIDLKTTRSVNPHEFERSVLDYRYHRQAAWYLDTLRLAGLAAETFVVVAVEKAAPHMVRIYELTPETIEAGRQDYRKHLARLRAYRESGAADVVEPIGLPRWYWRQQEEGAA